MNHADLAFFAQQGALTPMSAKSPMGAMTSTITIIPDTPGAVPNGDRRIVQNSSPGRRIASHTLTSRQCLSTRRHQQHLGTSQLNRSKYLESGRCLPYLLFRAMNDPLWTTIISPDVGKGHDPSRSWEGLVRGPPRKAAPAHVRQGPAGVRDEVHASAIEARHRPRLRGYEERGHFNAGRRDHGESRAARTRRSFSRGLNDVTAWLLYGFPCCPTWSCRRGGCRPRALRLGRPIIAPTFVLRGNNGTIAK